MTLVVVVSFAGGAVASLATRAASAASAEVGTFARPVVHAAHGASVLTCDADGLRYAYHVPTGTQSMYDLHVDPHELHNVLAEHQELAGRLRREIEARLDVRSLDTLRVEHDATIRKLRALGYL